MHRALAFLSLLAGLAATSNGFAQQAVIKQPGAHTRYGVELEPHFTFQWDGGPDYYADDGVGLGMRVGIPLFHNGPIPQINNNMAISFGFDWVHFGYDRGAACRRYQGAYCDDWDFSANSLWFPVTLQWNFYVHRRINVFGEVGFAIRHTRYSWLEGCGGPTGYCEYTDSTTRAPYFVFYPGARFLLSDTVSIMVRVGYPHFTAGVSFLL
ncbi:MAG TPA: hypothetical protein VFQ35_20695 [Polyangiaceae bacterium]|nr:hypothetical protein [Polyangiaceae bacterium]